MTTREASQNFFEVIASIGDSEETLIVDDAGETVAVVLSPEAYQKMAYDRFWATVDRIRERNADKDPDEVYQDVTAVVEEVRQERYEAEQRRIARRSR
jgi:PHD/YefM family antitoxin component YafN of YafNO toxin-antitoxin module